MKKAVFLFCLIAAAGSVLFAQNTAPVTTTVSGTFSVSAGRIAVKSGNITYYPRGIQHLVGFIDGLKEGAQVTMEGYASVPFMEGQTELFFSPVKLTLNGKTYDMGQADFRMGPGPLAYGGRGMPGGFGMGGGHGYGRGGRGPGGFGGYGRGGCRGW